jgi:phage/plasmid-associated DNA primase
LNEFLRRADPVIAWANERCDFAPDVENPRRDLYDDYNDYAVENDLHRLSDQQFYRQVESRFNLKLSTYGRNSYIGIMLKSQF